jgi:hypothetical protein
MFGRNASLHRSLERLSPRSWLCNPACDEKDAQRAASPGVGRRARPAEGPGRLLWWRPDRVVDKRLAWLEGNAGGYQPALYDQPADDYRRFGHERRRRSVLIAKQQRRRRELPPPARAWSKLEDIPAGLRLPKLAGAICCRAAAGCGRCVLCDDPQRHRSSARPEPATCVAGRLHNRSTRTVRAGRATRNLYTTALRCSGCDGSDGIRLAPADRDPSRSDRLYSPARLIVDASASSWPRPAPAQAKGRRNEGCRLAPASHGTLGCRRKASWRE